MWELFKNWGLWEIGFFLNKTALVQYFMLIEQTVHLCLLVSKSAACRRVTSTEMWFILCLVISGIKYLNKCNLKKKVLILAPSPRTTIFYCGKTWQTRKAIMRETGNWVVTLPVHSKSRVNRCSQIIKPQVPHPVGYLLPCSLKVI